MRWPTAPSGSGVLEGTVKERGTRRKLAGVGVALRERREETETDAEGRFRFQGLAAGTYHVVALRPGYTRFVETVTLAEGESSEVVLLCRKTDDLGDGADVVDVVTPQRQPA